MSVSDSHLMAPGFGISEDPATGGASGPLGCYLLHHEVVAPDQARSMLSLQGVAMKRPSRLFISIESRDGAITRVRVGGKAVIVAVQTTLQPLLELGVEPNYVTSLDYHEICTRFFEKLPAGLKSPIESAG